MGDISDAEKIQIVNHFLKSSPPGEFNYVLSDVRGILQNDTLLNQHSLETFRTYNTEQMIQVKNGDHQALITKFNEVSPNEYLDPAGGVVMTFDHIKQVVTGTRGISGELDASVEPFRKAIESSTLTYVDDHYANGAGAVFSSKKGGENEVTICISSSIFNPNNFWNGRWRSSWTVSFKPGGQAKLEGNIHIVVHFFEDGNVQLVSKFKKNSQINAPSDGKQLGDALLKHIGKLELEYQNALENSYNTMGETTFKALRRVLPVTREKVKWEKIGNYKVGSEAVSGSNKQ